MPFWKHAVSILGPRRVILGLGGLYAVAGIAWAFFQTSIDTSVPTIVIVSSFIGGSGIALLIGGYRLPHTEIDPTFHSVVAVWCFVGLGGMLVILGLYHLQPGGELTNPSRSLFVLTGFSTVAGLGIGVHDARAKTATRELERQNQELKRVQTQLENSNERLDQFAHAASHDLQEPLRMVSSYLRLIDTRYANALDEDGQEFLDYAKDGADRMKRMIDGLLDYSRVNTRGSPLEPVDLNRVLADVQKNLEIKTTETNATITSDELPKVNGDASQLRQVFQNLLSNALEYTGDEPPRIDISAERTGAAWTISVRDHGIGIPQEKQDGIFEVFERLHTQDEHPGTGIGLALCSRIIERHNGDIWVESRPNDGTTFQFTLPSLPSPQPA